MAANYGKYTDRSPSICAAGLSSSRLDHYNYDDGVDLSLKENPLKDDAARITFDEKTQTKDVSPELIQTISLQETQTKLELLEKSQVKDDFEEIMKDLNKNSSFKKYLHTEDEDSIKELMNPPRTPYQVMWDSQVGHERYRTTHDDYNAPKEIEEGVEALTFEPNECLKTGRYNSNGIWVRCTCDWHKKEAIERSSDIEADYVDRYKSQIGKSLNPNHNIKSVPEGFTFGTHSQQATYGMEELTKDSDCPPCVFRKDFYKWISALNKCRNSLKDRRYQEFKFNDFYAKSLSQDKEKTGFLPINVFYDICAQENVTFHKEEIESLLKVLHIIVDDRINYGRFIEIIDVTKPAIDIVPLHDLPTKNQYYKTSNQTACDYLITNNADLRPAGMPSAHDGLVESNVPHPQIHNWSEESPGSPLNFPPEEVVSATDYGLVESNVAHPPLHNWSEETSESPLNFAPDEPVSTTHDGLVESNVAHAPLHNWSEESSRSPLNFHPNETVSTTHDDLNKSNAAHPSLHNWSKEFLQNPRNFKNN